METVKGFRDLSGEEAEIKEKIKEILVRNFKLYGFEPVETPIIENEKFVRGENTGDEAVSDIFKLQDKGKRKLALRYEFTFQLKRLVKGKKLPYKRYQVGEVFRDEPTKPGRFRQFTQCDADIVGSSEITADAEILALTSSIFKELKIPVEIQVNNRQLLTSIIESLKVVRDKKTELKVMREVDKLEKSRDEAYRNLKKLIGAEETDMLLEYFDKPLSFFIKQGFAGASDIEQLKKLLKVYKVRSRFVPSLARGLSYYTGNVFEIKSKGAEFTITAGGRYEVNNLPAVGISFGLDRIIKLAKIDADKEKVLVISIGEDEKAAKLAEKLRGGGVGCKIMYKKIIKSLEYANSKKIPYVIFVGKEEAKKKKVKLRNMKTGKESLVSEKELIKKLQ